MQFFEYWVYRISSFEVIRVTIRSKFDEKKIKDGRRDPNIFTNFLKNWCSLGINTCIQYVEQQMNWKSGFVDIRVTWMRGGDHARRRRRRRPHTPADETVQKLKASPW